MLKQFSKSIFIICLFVGISITGIAQSTFYKYLYHGYNSGRNFWLGNCVVLDSNKLALSESVMGHGVNSTSISYYDSVAIKIGGVSPQDSLIPQATSSTETYGPFKTTKGFITSHLYYNSTTGGKDRFFSIHHDMKGKEIWKAKNAIFYKLTHSDKFGAFGMTRKLEAIRIDETGKHIFTTNTDSLRTIRPKNALNFLHTLAISPNEAWTIFGNKTDSCQIIKLDTMGNVLNDTLILGKAFHDILFYKNQWVTIEKDTSFQVVFRNLNFKETHRYSFTNEFPLIYSKTIFKDSLLTILMINDVDGKIYGTRNIPEIRVLNLNGKYLRKRYLRYNGGYMDIKPWNAISPIVVGIDYTKNNGYYISLTLETGTYDGQHGLLKTDSNIMANDTIFVPAIRIYLNQWDTILTPIKHKPSTIKEMEIEYGFTVFPNPASNLITISSKINLKAKLLLLDLNGKEIFKSTFSGNQKEIDVSHFNSGVYLLVIKTEKGIIRKKIIIKNE